MVCGCVEVKAESVLTENVCDTFMRTVGRSVCMLVKLSVGGQFHCVPR